MKTKKEIVSFAASTELHKRADADLLLTQPHGQWDVAVLKFQSRKALEEFNKKSNLNAVVKTQVPLNCAIYRHQSDSEARKLQELRKKYHGEVAETQKEIRESSHLTGEDFSIRVG